MPSRVIPVSAAAAAAANNNNNNATQKKKKQVDAPIIVVKKKKKIRFRAVTHALRNIRRAQQSTSSGFRRAPITRLVKRFCATYSNNNMFLRRSTVEAFEQVTMHATLQIFQDAYNRRLVSLSPEQSASQHMVQIEERHLDDAFRLWRQYHSTGDFDSVI